MKAAYLPVAEITANAIALLCREIGVVNTARFMNQFTPGLGNYTEERHDLLGSPSVHQLAAEIKRTHEKAKRPAKGKRTQPRGNG